MTKLTKFVRLVQFRFEGELTAVGQLGDHNAASGSSRKEKSSLDDREDGEPRLKRKRIEPLAATAERNAAAIGTKESEANNSLVRSLVTSRP